MPYKDSTKRTATRRARYAANRDTVKERVRAYHAANRDTIKEQTRAYHAANRDTIKERVRTYRAANRELIKEQKRAYYRANREQIKEQRRAYREANRVKTIARDRAYYRANRELIKEQRRAYREANLEKRRISDHNRNARQRSNGGTFTAVQWRALCDCFGNGCLCCGAAGKLSIDHVIPLIRGGANSIENLQPLCMSCNSSKQMKDTDYRDPIRLVAFFMSCSREDLSQ